MSENYILLDLLLYRPRAYILLSYLHLIAKEKGLHPFNFFIQDIRPLSGRVVLTKEQVRSNLALLHERGFIKVEKLQYPVRARQITLLTEGVING